jgi:hypothetical protein
MDLWLMVIVSLLTAIFSITVFALNAIATICKHGGVTIRVIQDSPRISEPTQPYEMSEEEKKALQQWNEDQAKIVESYKNFQEKYYGLFKEDNT